MTFDEMAERLNAVLEENNVSLTDMEFQERLSDFLAIKMVRDAASKDIEPQQVVTEILISAGPRIMTSVLLGAVHSGMKPDAEDTQIMLKTLGMLLFGILVGGKEDKFVNKELYNAMQVASKKYRPIFDKVKAAGTRVVHPGSDMPQ